MSPAGYHGKVLHIDLNARRAWSEEPDDRFWRIYGGGGLLAAYYLLRETPAHIDAFDPANLLILTSSVVAGHPYAGLARYTAAGKSPLTNGIGETRCEGPFGVALKGSGADVLIFHGAADRPTTVLIEEGKVSFHDASALWGRTVNQTVDGLEAQFGADIHTAVIGPAGENRVRFASIVSESAKTVNSPVFVVPNRPSTPTRSPRSSCRASDHPKSPTWRFPIRTWISPV